MTYYVMTRENLADLTEAWPDSEARWNAYEAVKAENHGCMGTAHARPALTEVVA